MNRPLAATALIAAFAMLPAAPAAAQQEDSGKYNTVIIYGDDACPVSEGDVITVCARMDESERYRIPPNLRESDSPSTEAWSRRVRSFETVGRTGPMSCSAVGAGGELGCTAEFINEAYQEKAESSDVRFSQLIAEERAARLATLDEEAAETQARVEELERAYMERLRREQAGETGPAEPIMPDDAETVNPADLPPADLGPPVFEEDEPS